MSDATARARYRGILTETLPYEVPVIFSNDSLFLTMTRSKPSINPDTDRVIKQVIDIKSDGSIPYSYGIIKDDRRYTSLGIIHPTTQLKISTFYETFSTAILESCSRSEFSLRRPHAETDVYSSAEVTGSDSFKLGIAHADPADGEIDVSHISSYFAYGKYNLLGKFIDSAEFSRLEKRFRFLRTLDVSKCFFNIYTHSISWAIKGKGFSKTNKTAFSFESQFDSLMQSANYGETNGIVVGPEISRIFAEIIMQDIDRRVMSALLPLINNRDYAVRRYVDDFFVFANSLDDIEVITSLIEESLEFYKLFTNQHKTNTRQRPFVSDISLGRSDVAKIINDLYDIVTEPAEGLTTERVSSISRTIRHKTSEVRQVCGRYNIQLGVFSGWLLSNLRNILNGALKMANSAKSESTNAIFSVIASLIELIFYICAVDFRVRTGYSLCQILQTINDIKALGNSDLNDRINHLLHEEFAILVRNAISLPEPYQSGVELSNILIAARHFLGPDILRSDAISTALNLILNRTDIRYFHYITVKFCFLGLPEYSEALKLMNSKAVEKLSSDKSLIKNDAEAYLLFCDLLSAPDLSDKEKASLYRGQFGGKVATAAFTEIGKYVGFVDWTGMAIQHTLKRKSLRPVYSWS